MSIDKTLEERGARYGDFADHAAICQKIKLAFLWGPARWGMLSDVQKQALEVIADKIARILSGDPNYADNWHDIQGYAKLVEDRLPKDADRHPMTPNVIEPASLMDDDSPRMQAIGQNGNDGAVYSELDRLQAAADFNDDIPVGGNLEMVSKATAEAREPKRPRHLCATCAQGHATHECKAGLGGER